MRLFRKPAPAPAPACRVCHRPMFRVDGGGAVWWYCWQDDHHEVYDVKEEVTRKVSVLITIFGEKVNAQGDAYKCKFCQYPLSAKEPRGLSDIQERILLAALKLRGPGNNSIDKNRLERELSLETQENLTEAIDRLQNQGFLEQKRLNDQSFLSLTPLGMAILSPLIGRSPEKRVMLNLTDLYLHWKKEHSTELKQMMEGKFDSISITGHSSA